MLSGKTGKLCQRNQWTGPKVPRLPVEPIKEEPIKETLFNVSDGDLLGDDPASIERWLAWFDSLEPLNFTPEEEAAWHAAR